jgi:hypothetical protein
MEYVPVSLPNGPLEIKVPSALNSQDQSPFTKAPVGKVIEVGDDEGFVGEQPAIINKTKKSNQADFTHPLMVLLLTWSSIVFLLPNGLAHLPPIWTEPDCIKSPFLPNGRRGPRRRRSGGAGVSPCMIEKTSNSIINCQTHLIDLIQLQTEQTLLFPSLQLFQRVDGLLKMDWDVHPMLVE